MFNWYNSGAVILMADHTAGHGPTTNPRHGGWDRGTGKLTLQELKQKDSTDKEIKELTDIK